MVFQYKTLLSLFFVGQPWLLKYEIQRHQTFETKAQEVWESYLSGNKFVENYPSQERCPASKEKNSKDLVFFPHPFTLCRNLACSDQVKCQSIDPRNIFYWKESGNLYWGKKLFSRFGFTKL